MFGWVEVEEREENKIRRGKGKDKGKPNSFLCVFGCRREEKVEKGNKKERDHFTILSL